MHSLRIKTGTAGTCPRAPARLQVETISKRRRRIIYLICARKHADDECYSLFCGLYVAYSMTKPTAAATSEATIAQIMFVMPVPKVPGSI